MFTLSFPFYILEVKPDALKMELAVDDEEVEPDSELQTALARARRLRQAEERAAFKVPKVGHGGRRRRWWRRRSDV